VTSGMILKRQRMSQGALMQACGHMDLDEGEELSIRPCDKRHDTQKAMHVSGSADAGMRPHLSG